MKRLLPVVLLMTFAWGQAQETQIIHHMNWVPQSLRSNPAQLPDYKFFIGLPAISSVYVGVDMGVSFRDIVQELPNDTFLIDPGFILSNLENENLIGVTADLDLLSFGFRIKRAYLTMSLAERNRFRFAYPKSLLEFLWKGNGAFIGEPVDLSALAVEASAYGEAAVGMSLPIGNHWIVAGRFKFLSGLGQAHIQPSAFELYTDPESYAIRIRSGLDLYTAGAEIDISKELDFNFEVDPELFMFRNPGFSFDAAATFMPTDRWRLSAGIFDMGSIRWEAEAKRHYVKEGEYTFSGLEIGDVFKADSVDFTAQLDKIVDTLKIIFDLQSEKASYSRALQPLIFASAEYQFTRNTRLGALMRGEYFADRFYPTFNFALHQRLGRVLSLSGSYTIRNRSYYDIGAGLTMKLGPMQLYILGDNILNVIWPEQMRSFSLHMGMNLVFGKPMDRKEKLMKMMEEEPSEAL